MTTGVQIERVKVALSAEDHTEGLKKLIRLIERSILTLRALPDKEHRFVHKQGNGWPEYPLEYSPGLIRKFRPDPYDCQHYLQTLGWLAWLGRETGGKQEVRIIYARAYGLPWWQIAEKVGQSRRTAKRLHDGALSTIYGRFYEEILRL